VPKRENHLAPYFDGFGVFFRILSAKKERKFSQDIPKVKVIGGCS
jgi:hypothetical protein